jgi:hypothetical protein
MNHRRVLILAGLAALLALGSSCTRSDVGIPSPAGPSTLSVTFELEAIPNVILATAERPMTTVRATVRKNGSPVPNVSVYLTIVSGPGQFPDYFDRVTAVTDSTGIAAVTFIGPNKFEMTRDMTTVVQGQMQTFTPTLVYKNVEIRIIRDAD